MTQQSLAEQVRKYVRVQYQLPVEKVALMLPTFLEVLKNHLNDLESVLDDGEPMAIGRVGHTLKGALLNLGLAEIAEIAASIETEGKLGNKDFEYAVLVARLREKLEEIL